MTNKLPQVKTFEFGKNVTISKSAKISCNLLKLGNEITISDKVEIKADEIIIKDNSFIGPHTKIIAKKITIGQNSSICKDSDIFVIENFVLGDRSDLCQCNIKGRNVKIGNDFFSSVEPNQLLIVNGGSFLPTSNLSIGDRCTIHNISINLAMDVKIGNDVGISFGTKFITHSFWNSIFEGSPHKFAGITISDGCIIGVDCIFLADVVLGKDCVIGAGSIVTKSFPSECIIAGNPAKIIKNKYKKIVSSKKRLEIIKSTLKWYTDILRTKGYAVKKIDRKGLEYEATNQGGITTSIIYSSNKIKTQKYKKMLILSFTDLPQIANSVILNLSKRTITGLENELTDDMRDFLRKMGIRIFSTRRFCSIPVVSNV